MTIIDRWGPDVWVSVALGQPEVLGSVYGVEPKEGWGRKWQKVWLKWCGRGPKW